MSTAAVTQQPDLDVVQHPVLGPLKFPKDMGPDERNEAIDRAMAARPNAGLAPVAGGPKSQPQMQPSYLMHALQPEGDIQNPQQPAESFALAHPEERGNLLGAAAVGAIGALPSGTIAPIARAGLNLVKAHPIASTIALEAAKQLPIVGKYASKIPSWLPLMAGGHPEISEREAIPGKLGPEIEEGPRFPSGNMRAQEGEYVESQPAAPSGPPIARSEVVRPLGLPESASAARDLRYRRGPGEVAPEDVSAPDENVLAGRQGVRIARPVERGPQHALPAATAEASPASIAPPKSATPITDPGKLGDLLNEGTGGELPEGHTAVKGSSLIRSYKYDPATKEFEAGLNGNSKTPGGVYVHGDVEPEAVAKFEATKSKGAAWKELKDTPGVTYVGKIVNGERVYAKPPRDLGSASPNDLTPILQDSLDAVKAKKAARIARPN